LLKPDAGSGLSFDDPATGLAQKRADVGGSIWEFINAAANINKDGNDMATVTRVYSRV
jgi:hypothetical protein